MPVTVSRRLALAAAGSAVVSTAVGLTHAGSARASTKDDPGPVARNAIRRKRLELIAAGVDVGSSTLPYIVGRQGWARRDFEGGTISTRGGENTAILLVEHRLWHQGFGDYESRVPGYPLADEAPVPGTSFRVQPFEAGHGWYGPDGDVATVLAVDAYYVAAGGLTGPLGRPLADPVNVIGDDLVTHQQFRHGTVWSSARTPTVSTTGAIDRTYVEAGGVGSALGLPVAEVRTTDRGFSQRFEHGVIVWVPGKGTTIRLT
ncbi:LGFP repeat-containing protein [Terracoccus luteus]|uniref:LGFP repeat-containing protein n=1 Tax=Terracoccus luteus TaxID=53356 RepID=A0A839Q022_9MICO|nr:hypothetical protein [Terracoccus luteus]MBB2987615.1 hypothetical protein [Terracoccus luteus]MCP2173266.1 hypothetical protein [Terracoccus luteus]